MPDRELVLRTKCEHGTVSRPCVCVGLGTAEHYDCPGGSETVLDPDRVLQIEDPEFGEISFIRVADILDALGGSDE